MSSHQVGIVSIINTLVERVCVYLTIFASFFLCCCFVKALLRKTWIDSCGRVLNFQWISRLGVSWNNRKGEDYVYSPRVIVS